MGREQLQSFNIGMNLSLVGIGATLQTEDGYCKIRELVPGGPAARSGQLKNGDRIVGVAQGESKEFTDLVDMPLPQAVDLIRGAKGTTVRLTIIPAGAAGRRGAQDGLDRARRDQTRRPAGQGAHRRSARRGREDAARRCHRSARLLRQRGQGRALRDRRCRQARAQAEAGKRDRTSSSTCAATAEARWRKRSVSPASSSRPARSCRRARWKAAWKSAPTAMARRSTTVRSSC